MLRKLVSSKKIVYVLMAILVFLWGMEYIAAKAVLDVFKPLSLIFVKYTIGLVLLIIMKAIVDRRLPLRRRDIPLLFICSLFGDVFYFAGEYGAMAYLPVSVITILLAFLPCVSVITEIILYKNKPSVLIVAGILVSVIGVGMVIGADFSELFQKKYIGYLLAFGAVISWNIYNFVTKGLTERYNPLDLTLLQQICAILLVLPYAVFHFPDAAVMNPQIIISILYIGVINGFLGFLIYINAIDVIGPTPCALYLNFLPVASTFLGWILLNEYISFIQILGGLVVIFSGVIVIWQKEKEGQSIESSNINAPPVK